MTQAYHNKDDLREKQEHMQSKKEIKNLGILNNNSQDPLAVNTESPLIA